MEQEDLGANFVVSLDGHMEWGQSIHRLHFHLGTSLEERLDNLVMPAPGSAVHWCQTILYVVKKFLKCTNNNPNDGLYLNTTLETFVLKIEFR